MTGNGSGLRAGGARTGAALAAAWLGIALTVPAAALAAPADADPPPGPPVLSWAPADAPQLQNTGSWAAPPILVSGSSAYRAGEFLYQDYIDDDHGAKQQADPNDPRTNNSFSAPNGTYTYPSNRAYANNAADFVELRVKPMGDDTALRLTFNTMTDPTLIGVSVAIGGTPGMLRPFPYGANTSAPAGLFLTVHPVGAALVANLTRADGGAAVAGPAPSVAVDVVRRQIEVRIPHAAFDPTGQTVRFAAGTGLWDRTANRYLLPQRASSATTPGGAGATNSPSAFFNVAFRMHEPLPIWGTGGPVQHTSDPAFWRDQEQGHALASGDISELAAQVDFAKLARGVSDDSGVPATGHLDRILASHFEPAQGADFAASCYGGDFRCQYQGRLQPYALYVPAKAPPATGYGMTLLLHANAANYNEFLGTRNATEFGERSTGSIVLTSEARDPGGSYTGYAAADVFEAWADAARHYPLDPSWRAIAGYSLGGLGTYKLAEQFPDLFARAVAIVGTPGGHPALGQSPELASLRNLPIMLWDSIPVDELNPTPEANALALDRLGYRYDYLSFPGEHLTPAYNDEYGPAASFLGATRVDPDPPHVTYVYAPDALDGLDRPYGDFPDLGLVAGHAFWVTGLRLRTVTAPCATYALRPCGGMGMIDAVSSGFGLNDPVPSGTQAGAGVLTGGSVFPALPYLETSQTWAAPVARPRADVLDLTTTNLAEVTIDPLRARVDCAAVVHIRSDGPVQVHLAGCNRSVSGPVAPQPQGNQPQGSHPQTNEESQASQRARTTQRRPPPATSRQPAQPSRVLAYTGWSGLPAALALILVVTGVAVRRTRRVSAAGSG